MHRSMTLSSPMFLLLLTCALTTHLATGCAGCSEEEPTLTVPLDMGRDLSMAPHDMLEDLDQNADMQLDAAPDLVDVPDGAKDLDEPVDLCVPQTMCTQEMCGQIPDGCGGELDCGSCERCVNGVPSRPDCACGLGVMQCERAQGISPQTCSLTGFEVLDDAPETCAQIIHVKASSPSALSLGTSQDPFKTFDEALAQATSRAASEASPTLILLDVDDPVIWSQQATAWPSKTYVLGAGIPDEPAWRHDAGNMTRVEITPTLDGEHATGLLITGDAEQAGLAHIRVVHERLDANSSALHFYGLVAQGLSRLVLHEVELEGGGARDGRDAPTGVRDGEDGGDGGDAYPITYVGGRVNDPKPLGADLNGANPGEEGVNPSCPSADGGLGGQGSYRSELGVTTLARDAEDGEDGGVGGDGGRAGQATAGQEDGEDGQRGESGASGRDGEPGKASLELAGHFFVTQTSGTDGRPGQDGHGGGGGGGSYWQSFLPNNIDASEPGVSGGGGGAGGCGGEAGQAGEGGGSAVQLVLEDITQVTLSQCTLASPYAGRGGQGRLGGNGGAGGQGGAPSTLIALSPSHPTSPHAHSAGQGGPGGRGGRGGSGGSGAGGASLGVMCVQPLPSLTVEGGVTFRLVHTEAPGGTHRKPGLEGQQGALLEQLGCQGL